MDWSVRQRLWNTTNHAVVWNGFMGAGQIIVPSFQLLFVGLRVAIWNSSNTPPHIAMEVRGVNQKMRRTHRRLQDWKLEQNPQMSKDYVKIQAYTWCTVISYKAGYDIHVQVLNNTKTKSDLGNPTFNWIFFSFALIAAKWNSKFWNGFSSLLISTLIYLKCREWRKR